MGLRLKVAWDDIRLLFYRAAEDSVPTPVASLRDRLSPVVAEGRSDLDWSVLALPLCSKSQAEKAVLPEANIVFGKWQKIFHFLATFQVHPWTVLTFHEPVPRRIDWSEKLVQEPLCGS